MTGRKTLAERVRQRAWSIHRQGLCTGPCQGPTQAEWEQATREVMGNEVDR